MATVFVNKLVDSRLFYCELRNSSKADIFKTLRKRGRREYDDSAESRRVRPLRRDRSSGLCGSDLAKSPTGLKNVC